MVLTRRGYQQQMEISRWLPNEVLAHVIQHSPKADQAALCRVSKLFRDLCLPVLYRVVRIQNPSYITSFCSGIIENPSRAQAVRSFTLGLRYQDSRINIRCDLVLAALKLMLRSDHLSISGSTLDNHHWAILLEEAYLPELISCDFWIPNVLPTPPLHLLALFFARHSTLKRVQFHSGCDLVASQSVRVSLPNLEFYKGDADFIPAINAIGLKEVLLTFYSGDDVDKIIVALSCMTKLDSPFVSSHSSGSWLALRQIVTSVSHHMKHTRTLRLQYLRNLYSFTWRLGPDTIRHITECLPRFSGLIYLEKSALRIALWRQGGELLVQL
ncbi:hypothetical protein C8R45DRAFT_965109 [Mycena sanguinolenta]|nr:hypothetical protein C8R45DRAFT_965109 [Mycena sanguinolenta]